jgi:hypothetical protein
MPDEIQYVMKHLHSLMIKVFKAPSIYRKVMVYLQSAVISAGAVCIVALTRVADFSHVQVQWTVHDLIY